MCERIAQANYRKNVNTTVRRSLLIVLFQRLTKVVAARERIYFDRIPHPYLRQLSSDLLGHPPVYFHDGQSRTHFERLKIPNKLPKVQCMQLE